MNELYVAPKAIFLLDSRLLSDNLNLKIFLFILICISSGMAVTSMIARMSILLILDMLHSLPLRLVLLVAQLSRFVGIARHKNMVLTLGGHICLIEKFNYLELSCKYIMQRFEFFRVFVGHGDIAACSTAIAQ